MKITDKQRIDFLSKTVETVGGWQVTKYGHTGGYQLIPHGREVFQRFAQKMTPGGKNLRAAIDDAMTLSGAVKNEAD